MFEKIDTIFSTVKGYTQRPALAVWDILLGHQERAGTVGNFCEIGVGYGLTATVAATHLRPGEKLVLVDYPGRFRQGVEDAVTTHAGAEAWRAVHWNAMDSREFRRGLAPAELGPVRWFHIDGEHTDEAVSNDLDVAHDLLGRDGIVCLDDFFSMRYIQVTQALFRYVDRYPDRFRLFLCGFNKGFLCRPSRLKAHLELIADPAFQDGMKERGQPCTLYKTTFSAELDCYGIQAERESPFFGPDWAVKDRSVYL